MQNVSLDDNFRLASQEIPRLMHVLKVYYHNLIPTYFIYHFNNILTSVLMTLALGLFPSDFSSE
jgi:hypothetical protein